MSRLAIVIVTHNSRAEVDALLGSLTTAPPTIDHEIVIVDNASSDGTPSHLRARWPAIRLIETGANLGFAAASNVGIRGSRGDLVLCLNPDTVVPAGALDRLAALIEGRPEVAVVGPRLIDGHGRAELSWGPMPTPWTELRQKLLQRGAARGWPVVAALVGRLTRRARAVDWVSGACLLIRRTDLEIAGLFDERYFMYVEDVDLCATVRRAGRVVLFAPQGEIVHLRGRSLAASAGTAHALLDRSRLLFYAKHGSRWAPLLRLYLTLRRRRPDTSGKGEV
jgi:GT2 family glycosyltransferase